jgi:glycine/D-amino acid oxidase-like deaminating enzyme/nitrite reductase/ring-hydroxylating ferredoxin subunit
MATGPQPPELPELEGDVRADVAVLGGGIVGITTALLLKEAGVRVVLLEADRLAAGVTGHTTAKVSSQHGMIYSRLRSSFGADTARTYGQANEAALAWIRGRVERDGIECDLRTRPSFAYLSEGSDPEPAAREAEAAAEAGLPASLVDETPLPYPVAAAVRFEDQAELHIRKYLLALAEQLRGDGCDVFEGSRAVEVDEDEQCTVKTPGGRVLAERVVVATHYPFLDRSLAFARVFPERSYALVCRFHGDAPEGMFISGDSPTRSVRAVPIDNVDRLLVGGEGHRTGTGGDTRERYARLEAFAREHWDVTAVEYAWSAQDNTTLDGLPYVGAANPLTKRILMATGFAKWGITGGTAAAHVLADSLTGRENPAARIFDPNRFHPRGSVKLVEEGVKTGLHMVGDRVRERGSRPIESLEPGEGGIVALDGQKVAGHRRDDGSLVAVSSVCTHMGCQVAWNTAERSWDCPCHGSRFSPDGDVLQGPAVHGLERRPVEG